MEVAPLEELQKAVEEHPMIPWNVARPQGGHSRAHA